MPLIRHEAFHSDETERRDAKQLMLAQRLESALRELQATTHERDRLSATLDEVLPPPPHARARRPLVFGLDLWS